MRHLEEWCARSDDDEPSNHALALPGQTSVLVQSAPACGYIHHLDPSSRTSGINYTLNPDLRKLQGLALLDKIVAGAQQAGLCVIFDQHRPDAYAIRISPSPAPDQHHTRCAYGAICAAHATSAAPRTPT